MATTPRPKTPPLSATLAAALFFAAACSNGAPAPTPGVGSVTAAPETATPPASATPVASTDPASSSSARLAGPMNLTIATNTQATIGDVRIGAGNFWEEEWDEGGQKRKGRTAMLWIYSRDDASKNDKIRVHPGSTFNASRLKIEVTSVGENEVELRVTDSSGPSSSAAAPQPQATPHPSGSATMTASIGVATMEADGTIVLQLRAEGPGAALGDARLSYPRTHKDYDMVLKHVGGLKPGESKPVAPWPD